MWHWFHAWACHALNNNVLTPLARISYANSTCTPRKSTFLSFEVRIRQKISSYMNTAKCIEPMVGLGCQEVRVM